MPIATQDLGKYRRPGIFIEEIDNSIIEIPIQDVLINLIPGFSKKGPINSPIYFEDRNEFVKVFGDIDGSLERKGSYFHRTVLKMLESGPVWALNLLKLEDDRDKIQWVSTSCSSKFDNYGTDVERQIPYSKIFNRQDFWERSDESFLDYIKTLDGMYSPDRLLEMVNVGDKAITVFLFKSRIEGFDITAEEWYGGRDKVPNFMNITDWMSDWMIQVIILQGDWTNYKDLSVDTTYANYFTSNGLIKDQVEDFMNERTVTVLGSYDVSLIPYFTDLDGRDLYIRSIINNNTDTNSLFISYDEEQLLDADYPLDIVDILGNNLVGTTVEAVDYLSYNQSIVETVTIEEQLLDAPINVFAEMDDISKYEDGIVASLGATDSRGTAQYSKWFVNGVTKDSTTQKITFVTGVTNGDTIDTSVSHSLLNLEPVYFNNTFGNIAKNTIYYVYNPTLTSFQLKTQLDPDDILTAITDMSYDNISIQTMAISSYISVAIASDAYFVLDNQYTLSDSGSTVNIPLNPIVLSPDPVDDESQIDIVYLEAGNDSILIGSEDGTYDSDNIILSYVTQSFGTGATFTGNTFTGVVSDVSIDANGYVPIVLDIQSGGTDTMIINFSEVVDETYRNWRKDLAYELLALKLQEGAGQGKFVLLNVIDGSKYIVGTNYIIDDASIAITGLDTPDDFFFSGATFSANTFVTYFIDNEFVIQGDTDKLLTTLLPVESLVQSGITGVNNAGVIGKQSAFYTNYIDGLINTGDYFFKYNDPTQLTQIYLRMYVDAAGMVTIDFVNSPTGTSPQPITDWVSKYDSELDIISQLGNLKQNVELENSSQYTDLTNTREVWVDQTRYSEVKVGSFLERYYVEDDLAVGQTPKKLVRVIRTVNDPDNIAWKILYTDGPIKITTATPDPSVSDYQTTQYSSIEDYVSEYKGIKISPFVMSSESIPNGTDERQSDILDVLGKSTNLFLALADKNKITWRYLIDSFGLGLNTSSYPGGSKQQYADLCGEKKNCFGFIAMPSARDFKNSTNPSFVDDNGALDSNLVKQGGDPDKNPAYLYEFANGIGRSTIGYFFPFVRISDGSSNIPQEVPPSAYMATTYMQKFLGVFSNVQPWTISAGITNGRVSGIAGTEMDFNTIDEENYFQMGANIIVFRRNNGYVINSENTAQIFPRSSLSLIHSREVLIEIENRMYDMLLRYQWRFNTPEIRSEIKYRADQICKEIQQSDGIYNFQNVCDETNNTDMIIDLSMGVLDTYIEIIKGMGIIVNNITILKKGAIASGGFI
jgi:hypothetical protein